MLRVVARVPLPTQRPRAAEAEAAGLQDPCRRTQPGRSDPARSLSSWAVDRPLVSGHVLAGTQCTACLASHRTAPLLSELSQRFGFSGLDSLDILVLLSARQHFCVIKLKHTSSPFFPSLYLFYYLNGGHFRK